MNNAPKITMTTKDWAFKDYPCKRTIKYHDLVFEVVDIETIDADGKTHCDTIAPTRLDRELMPDGENYADDEAQRIDEGISYYAHYDELVSECLYNIYELPIEKPLNAPKHSNDLCINRKCGNHRYSLNLPSRIVVDGFDLADAVDSLVEYIQDHAEEIFYAEGK